MTRKRLALLGLIVAAALSAAGVAAAQQSLRPCRRQARPSTPRPSRSLSQVTCSVTGGDTFQATKATYTGTSSSSDPRLAGALTIRAWSLVDTTNGVGHVFGDFRIKGPATRAHGTLNAAIANGRGLRNRPRASCRHQWGRIVASHGQHVRPEHRLLDGLAGRQHRRRGIHPLGSSGARLRTGRRADERDPDGAPCARRPVDHSPAAQVTASRITNAAKATLITPFIVKNAVSSRRRSPGRTSECSYASRAATTRTPSQ